MSKIFKHTSVVMLMWFIAGCSNLGMEDKNLLAKTQSLAEIAARDALEASLRAEIAAEKARLESEKAERIFKQLQKK